jgi:hypothetical protein
MLCPVYILSRLLEVYISFAQRHIISFIGVQDDRIYTHYTLSASLPPCLPASLLLSCLPSWLARSLASTLPPPAPFGQLLLSPSFLS